MLDGEAHPGVRGILKDVLRLVWGTRLMAVVIGTALNPLPLLPLVPHVLLQVYSVLMVRWLVVGGGRERADNYSPSLCVCTLHPTALPRHLQEPARREGAQGGPD